MLSSTTSKGRRLLLLSPLVLRPQRRFPHNASFALNDRITTRAPIQYVPFERLVFEELDAAWRLETSKLRSEFARAELDGEPIAIRVLDCSPANHPACMRNWRAVQHLSNVLIQSHPGIVRLRGISQTPAEGKLLILTEHAENGSLEEYLSRTGEEPNGRLFPHRVRLLAEVSETMSYLHTVVGIAHRDLKASNVLVTADGTTRLADFETAVALDPLRKRSLPGAGSLLHKAPEMLLPSPSYDGEELCEYNARVDVWAFGVLIWEVLHPRETPYSHAFSTSPGLSPLTVEEFSRGVARGEVRLEWDVGRKKASDGVYAEMARLSEECLRLAPEDRPSFQEITQRLRRSLGGNDDDDGGTFFKVEYRGARNVAYALCQTKHRDTMEDFACAVEGPDFNLSGVFDGHMGDGAAAWASMELVLRMCRLMTEGARRGLPLTAQEELASVEAAFEATDESIRTLGLRSGTTALVIVTRKADVIAAWCGDSLAELYRASARGDVDCLRLVSPHKPEREDETARLRRAGGVVGREVTTLDSGETMPVGPYRVAMPREEEKGYFSVSRALGDSHAKNLLIGKPEVTHVARLVGDKTERKGMRDLFLIAGTDGFFDWVTPRAVLEEAFESGPPPAANDAEALAERLVRYAVAKEAHDNVSLVVVRLL